MKNIFYAIILITFLQNCSSDTYMNVIFEPKLEKFCGTYYMENFFYQKHHLNPKDTIKLIINKDHTFLAKHLPIKKYLQKDVSKFIDTRGKWDFEGLDYIKDNPKEELDSSLGLSLSFEDEELNNDMKNVLKNFENIKTNKKDSTKYLLMTHYLDSDDSNGFIQFRKEK